MEQHVNNNSNIIAETRSGKVRGIREDGLCIFKGVPYAAPPVGRLRWMPPQPVEPWSGVRPALEFGPVPPQNPISNNTGSGGVRTEPQSEDCLYLNIWSPGVDDEKRPVLLWLHGGAFCLGSGSNPRHDGSSLARRGNVVVVTINYRLGALGFLNLNELTGGKIPSTGNEGLLDQTAALRWVQDNIAGFGGDPGNITVFGESAGGMSISCLMASPLTPGLFQKAILQSGVGNMAISLSDAVYNARQFLAVLDIKPDDIDSLRSLSVARLLSAQKKVLTITQEPKTGPGLTATVPVIDGKVIPEPPLEAVKKGRAASIAVLIGTNLEETKFFNTISPNLSPKDDGWLIEQLKGFLPLDYIPGLIETYRQARSKRGESVTPVELWSAIDTDHMFRIPALRYVEEQSRHNPQTYNYLFTWKSPIPYLGACHTLDVGLVFGNTRENLYGSSPEVEKLSGNMQDAWTSFARTGDPGCVSLGTWPPYGSRRLTMILGNECRIEEAPYEEERRVWESLPAQFRGC